MVFEDLTSAIMDSVNSTFGVAENNPSNPKNIYSYKQLGKFSSKIDTTEERNYLLSGWIDNTRKVRPQNTEVLLQQPDITVLIKKKQFSSLKENFNLNLLDADERLYLQILKRLLFNKCKAIAAYERLSKIEEITKLSGVINDYVLPGIFSSIDTLNTIVPNLISGETLSAVETLKKVKNLSDTNNVTTWLNYQEVPYMTDVADGTGVIELTLVSSLNTTVTTKFGQGSASLNVENPNNLLTINTRDIEQAISDVVGFTNNNFFSIVDGQLNDTIFTLKKEINSLRQERGAAPLKYIINSNSNYFKKLRVIIDEEGREIIFNYDGGLLGFGSNVSFDANSYTGTNGLTENESVLLNEVIKNTYILFGLEQTRKNEILQFNKDNNKVRKRLELELNGKTIIQQMDSITIFKSSKTSLDEKISQGFSLLNNKNSLLNNIQNSINNTIDTFDGFFGRKESFIESEKRAIVGDDFPTWLWLMLRNQFTRQAAGVCTFSGIITDVSRSYNNGKYEINISAQDNCHYLEQSQINIKPAADAVDASLYDPLTPFKSDYDLSNGLLLGNMPELLDENKRLLLTGSVRSRAGRSIGRKLNEDNYLIKDLQPLAKESGQGKLRYQFFDPDGFVYRWKEGIGSLTLTGEPHNFGTGSIKSEANPIITNNPFVGQNVMNVLSLLITGIPYDFNNFIKSGLASGYILKDDLYNKNWHSSFLKTLINDINKSNSLWGNFIPLKRITLNQDAFNFLRSGQFDLTQKNQRINSLLEQRAELFDQLTTIFSPLAQDPQWYKKSDNKLLVSESNLVSGLSATDISGIGQRLINLDYEIEQNLQGFTDSLNNSDVQGSDLVIIGDDINLNDSTSYQDNIFQKERLRKKILEITQRRLWKVKANEDTNYFIVDDTYDQNYDIKAFEESLSNVISTFKSTYSTPAEQVQLASNLLGLEVFADTQGHINARPPAYNKIPSSVLLELLQSKQSKNISIFPEYLESLFFNQIKGITDKIEIIEDQIRLRTALLGAVDDATAIEKLKGSSGNSSNFVFLTDELDGRIKASGIGSLTLQANPDFLEESNRKSLDELSNLLNNSINNSVNFDIVQKVNIVNSYTNSISSGERVNIIAKRLKNKGYNDPLIKDIENLFNASQVQSDKLKLSNQLASLLSERFNLIKLLNNSVRNLQQGIDVNSSKDSLVQPLYNNKNFPEILYHMIEDEAVDDLGESSGKRYIIKDIDIISYRVVEKAPPFTLVQVNGSLANNLVQTPSGLDIGTNGNFMTSAFAVDYGMWRQYGFKGQNSVDVPFFTDPVTQCAPYATWLLNQARKNIFNIEIDMRGNEFIQAGEVYYLESEDLLGYAENVRHNYSFAGTFTTSLTLTYVRKPGDFIPTMLDIVGKSLYATQNQSDLIKNNRNNSAANESSLGVVINYSPQILTPEDTSTSESNIFTTAFADSNRKNLANIKASAAGLLQPTKFGSSFKVEARIYYNSEEGFSSANTSLITFAESIKQFLLNPVKNINNNDGNVTISDNDQDNNFNINPDDIEIVQIDLGKTEENRSPSSEAWSSARRMVAVDSAQILEKANLFNYVLDFWMVASDNTSSETFGTSSETNSTTNQAEQLEKDKYLKAFNKSLGIG